MDGEAMRALRGELGLTQRELAAKLGVSEPNVTAMETGRRAVGSGMRARLALVRIEHAVAGREGPVAKLVRELCAAGLGGEPVG
jgi:transcriptional regulator with XRE-family HTH domain